MAVAFRVTKATFDKMDATLQAEYKADGDKHYKLDVTGLEDTGALTRAKERAEQALDDIKADLAEAEKKVKTLEAAGGEGGKDVQKLTERFERRLVTQKEAADAVLASRDTFIKSQLIDNQATALATAISTVPSLMAKTIKERLEVDFAGDAPALVVKNKDGKVDPAMTVDKLKAELLANPELKPILVGNRATGSAAPQGSLPAGGATPAISADKVDVNTMADDAFVARVRAKAEQAKAAAGAGSGAT